VEPGSHDTLPDDPERARAEEHGPTDVALMERLARGDADALGPLMERHHRRIYRIALAYLRNPDDAMDAVQETFVKAFQNAHRWEGDKAVGPWLTKIAVNQSIDQYRRSRRRLGREEPLETEERTIVASLPSPEGVAYSGEISVRIERALKALPERQRAVFVLRHYEDMTLPEIAESLGMNLGTVKSNLHRALGRLRGRLAGLAP
jgi:RNA polymerase sigma-70 factor (ECF subfamily)